MWLNNALNSKVKISNDTLNTIRVDSERKYYGINNRVQQLNKRISKLQNTVKILKEYHELENDISKLRIQVFKELNNNQKNYFIDKFKGGIRCYKENGFTNEGMLALVSNSSIFSKINVPKYLFLFSKNVSALINFGIILVIYFCFIAFEGIVFTWQFLFLLYPVICLILINLGIGLILSALFIFFKDIQYLYRLLCFGTVWYWLLGV